MAAGGYLLCPKCKSAEIEIIDAGTKSKFNLRCLIDQPQRYTKKVLVRKCHCKKCGYLWQL